MRVGIGVGPGLGSLFDHTVLVSPSQHYHPLITQHTKLYCLVLTEAHVCERLAQSRYIKVERPGVEPATS